MTLSMIQFTPKCWILRYVSSTRWWELATWSTAKSAMKGWRYENTAKGRGRGWGRRLITPALGFAIWIGVGR